MKKTLLLAAVGMLASASSFANWEASMNSGSYVATVTAPGGSVSTSEAIPYGTAAPGPIGKLARSVEQLRNNLQQAILTQLQAAAAPTNSTITIYPVVHGTLTTSLKGLTGAYAGYNQLSIGGATTKAAISTSMSKWGIGATCTSTVTFNNVQFAATYNPVNGAILNNSAVTYANLNPSTFVSCSTSLDWVPFIGTMIDNLAAAKINTALQSGFVALDQQLVSTVFPTQTAQLGIDTVLTPGKFVIAGVDWGAYIDNNFATLFTGKSLTVSMAEYLPPSTTSGSVRAPADFTLDTKTLVVDFSDGTRSLTVSIDDVEDFTWDYVCNTSKCTNPL